MKPKTNTQQRPTDIPVVTHHITPADRWDHFVAHWGVNRRGRRVKPGLYALGKPTGDSPVLVTANYTLSFDALRSASAGFDCYIMVLDTKGINVWCAAGKETFGTEELVHRIEITALSTIVDHRILILPQLGASGVAAHEVKSRTGFSVEYGPIRAKDLQEYLKTREATPEMRRVRFDLLDRLILIPVELVHFLLPMVIAAIVLYFLGGPQVAAASIVAILAGTVIFPLVLPWIPTPNFSTKGFLLGIVVILPFALALLWDNPETMVWQRAGKALAIALAFPPVTAFLALNFTGSTPITSKSGVECEIHTYIPIMAWMFGGGLVVTVILLILNILGGVL
ncbi:MAG: carbon monoxide dehydrogenase [Gemmatimonadota bacterium]|nr:MAG: carbon monoxide dehydrogenase [Gemmatimonadota bacterium]